MISLHDLANFGMQQQIAQELYRQQIMQRIPDPFPPFLPLPIAHQMLMPARPGLPGAGAKLENNDLWQQFHRIGTEMIITKTGRRMFPSMRVSVSGLDEDASYCVLLEMVPIGECRFKYSGSHWVPAGGAEPQSPQRMFLHPDSPASGLHWQAQPILFNKVKLTNNTLDSNGHMVLASMHKYQPRVHVIRTADLNQIPWAPQQAFVFNETEFIAVTAYQNDRITKLKIDNNPFAKGFRESGQSRCKRKILTNTSSASSSFDEEATLIQSAIRAQSLTPAGQSAPDGSDDERSSNGSLDSPPTAVKRLRLLAAGDSETCNTTTSSSSSISKQQQLDEEQSVPMRSSNCCPTGSGQQQPQQQQQHHHHQHHHQNLMDRLLGQAASYAHNSAHTHQPPPALPPFYAPMMVQHMLQPPLAGYASHPLTFSSASAAVSHPPPMPMPMPLPHLPPQGHQRDAGGGGGEVAAQSVLPGDIDESETHAVETYVDVVSTTPDDDEDSNSNSNSKSNNDNNNEIGNGNGNGGCDSSEVGSMPAKRNSFSISAILANGGGGSVTRDRGRNTLVV